MVDFATLVGQRRTLPIMLSAETTECGLACLAMIARFYGHDVDLNGLRQRYPSSLSGTTLRSLMHLADQLGFSTRALRVELSDLDKLTLPAILHWDLAHFVVLRSTKRGRLFIHDPGVGVREVSRAEASQRFSGVALEVEPTPGVRPATARVPLRINSLWNGSRGLSTALLQLLGLTAALQILAFALPFQIQLVVDDAIGQSDHSLLAAVTIAFGALALLYALTEALRSWTIQVFSSLMTFQIMGSLVHRLLRLKADYFEKRHVGDILSRVGSAATIQDTLTKGLVASIVDGLMALLASILLFIYSAQLAAIVVVAVLINLAIAFAFYKSTRRANEESLVATGLEQSHLMESVRAATTIKLLGREVVRESAWRNIYGRVINATARSNLFQIWAKSLQMAVIGVQTSLVIYLGARLIIEAKGFSIGMLLAFLSFRQLFTDRAQSLVNELVQFRLLSLHLQRVGDIIASQPEPVSSSGIAASVAGRIEFIDVSFRYSDADPLILDRASLTIGAGEFVAITGPSGGGKTTLIKILLGLQPPISGEIRLDGQVATPALWRQWREQVGVVTQDDHLISGTLAENIAFLDPELNMERVEVAARRALIHDDIQRMPMAYLSLIGDMGSALSGGQRQRLLLARALYREPKVLILDEGTAHLDPQTELGIVELIATMPITRVVVAHRPALIERAERVFSVRRGALEVTRVGN